MRKSNLFLPVLAVVLASAGALEAQPARSYKALKYPALNQIKVPEPTRFELPNGMVVYLVEDHEVPMVSVSALVRTGSRWEPADKAGLASITGTVMRTGGTATSPGDRLDQELDRLGAYVETNIGEDSGRATVSVLKEDLDKGLTILADVLQHPAFPQDKIDLAKIAQRDRIARRNDSPNGIVFREFHRVLFGPNSPYARQPEYETINSITRNDLVAFHKQYFQPENMILGAWGDFDAAQMRSRIEKAFGVWARGGNPRPKVPGVDAAARERAGFYSINKDDMSQSWVVMGTLGGKRDDPDFCALEVMNEVLGGGFSSRLFSNVRSAQGLAYAVFSSWGAGWDRPGTLMVGGSSKPETTIKIYKSMRAEVERMASGGATADELTRAKDGILKGLAFEFDSTGKIVERIMQYDYYGYPKDYLQQYRAGIEKVAVPDVARVAKQVLQPERFAVVFLGKEKAYESPLASLGAVKELDITIPQPKQAPLEAATPEAIARGKALLMASRTATGGAALANVKDLQLIGDAVLHMGEQQVSAKTETIVNLSGKLLQKMQLPMGEMTIAFDGQSGWMRMGPQTRDIPESQRGETEGGFFRETISLLQNFEKYQVQAVGTSEIDGKKLEGVAVIDPARKQQVTVFLDPATNLITVKRFTGAIMGPPAETEEISSDFRDTNGIKIPFKTTIRQGGTPKVEVTVTEAKINPGVPDSTYKKP